MPGTPEVNTMLPIFVAVMGSWPSASQIEGSGNRKLLRIASSLYRFRLAYSLRLGARLSSTTAKPIAATMIRATSSSCGPPPPAPNRAQDLVAPLHHQTAGQRCEIDVAPLIECAAALLQVARETQRVPAHGGCRVRLAQRMAQDSRMRTVHAGARNGIGRQYPRLQKPWTGQAVSPPDACRDGFFRPLQVRGFRTAAWNSPVRGEPHRKPDRSASLNRDKSLRAKERRMQPWPPREMLPLSSAVCVKSRSTEKWPRAAAELAPATLKLEIVEIGQLALYNQDLDTATRLRSGPRSENESAVPMRSSSSRRNTIAPCPAFEKRGRCRIAPLWQERLGQEARSRRQRLTGASVPSAPTITAPVARIPQHATMQMPEAYIGGADKVFDAKASSPIPRRASFWPRSWPPSPHGSIRPSRLDR